MENIEFSRSDRTTWLLVFGGLVFIAARVVLKIEHWGYPEIFLTFGMALYFFLLVFIISDILKKKNKHKVLWIISMFLLPAVAPIIYMIRFYYSNY